MCVWSEEIFYTVCKIWQNCLKLSKTVQKFAIFVLVFFGSNFHNFFEKIPKQVQEEQFLMDQKSVDLTKNTLDWIS